MWKCGHKGDENMEVSEDVKEYVGIFRELSVELSNQEMREVPTELIPQMTSTVFIQRAKNREIENGGKSPSIESWKYFNDLLARSHEGRQKEASEFIREQQHLSQKVISKSIDILKA